MAVTANQIIVRRDGSRQSYPVAASTTIYEGTLGFVDETGYVASVINSGINRFAGVSVKQIDNSSGTDGAKNAEFYTDGIFLLTGSGFGQEDVGRTVYATDNYTIALTATSAVPVGVIHEFKSSTQVYVKIKTFAGQQVAVTADDSESVLNMIPATAKAVNVVGVTNGANDFVVLPPIADVPIGHEIVISANAGSNFELRTPDASGTKINDVDSDGTQEYLVTDTHVVRVVKHTTTGWVGVSFTKLGAVVTAVVPD